MGALDRSMLSATGRGEQEAVRYRSIPTNAPDIHPAIVPERIERRPSETISARRSGTIAPMPPIRMPRLPKLAKPHIAYIIMRREWSLSWSAGILGLAKAFDFRRPFSMISRGMRLCLAPVIRAEFFEGSMTDVSSA